MAPQNFLQTQINSESDGVVAAGSEEHVLAWNDKGKKWEDILHSDEDNENNKN